VEYKPLIRLDFRKNRIVLTKRSLCDIGSPDYIILLVEPEKRKLVIMASDITVRQAHRIRKTDSSEVEFYSKHLLKALRQLCVGWQDNGSYRIRGEVVQGGEALRFSVDDFVTTSAKGD
jgi:hypothetical protein